MRGIEEDNMTGYINNILTANSGYECGYILEMMVIYFSSIKTIINDNWTTLGQKFQAVGIE